MAGLSKTEKEALELFKKQLQAEFGDRLDSTQLFGSKARGDAAKHSDIDVLVVIKDLTGAERQIISRAASRVMLETGILISAKKFKPEEIDEMRRRRSMFWQNIEPDLIPL